MEPSLLDGKMLSSIHSTADHRTQQPQSLQPSSFIDQQPPQHQSGVQIMYRHQK